MSFIQLLLISVGLSMDAFAVSLGAGSHEHVRGLRSGLRLAFHLGLFQGLMTLLGWLLGATVEKIVVSYDHWIAFGLLAFVGVRMVIEGLDPKPSENKGNPTRGFLMLSLCVATSIDALAVGISLGLVRSNIWIPSLVIGVVTAAISLGGVKIGRILGDKFGKRMEVFGGALLVLLGLHILISHLFP